MAPDWIPPGVAFLVKYKWIKYKRQKSLCEMRVKWAHPNPGGSTSADVAPLQRQPPQWVCEGRCLHRASRNNCSPACTCGRSATPYSQPIETNKTRCTIRLQSILFDYIWHHLSRRQMRSKGMFLYPWHKTIRQCFPCQIQRVFIHLPPLELRGKWWFFLAFGTPVQRVCLTLLKVVRKSHVLQIPISTFYHTV